MANAEITQDIKNAEFVVDNLIELCDILYDKLSLKEEMKNENFSNRWYKIFWNTHGK